METSFTPLTAFEGSRSSKAPLVRLESTRKAARRFHEQLMGESPVPYYQSFDLIRVPYPTRYGFRDACSAKAPLVHILNRMFVIQFSTPEGLKILLVSPSDIEGNRETPFFKRLGEKAQFAGASLDSVLAPVSSTVEEALEKAGISPEQVDYITYDHLHTQDLRKWFGSTTEAGYFPNAKLLVMRQEWESTQALLPTQAQWYCPGGTAGVPAGKVLLLDGDTKLGEGLALIQTPGHTEGNHSIVVRTSHGIFVTSENGISVDSYSPLSSRIPGLRDYARSTGCEVVLNGNTLEGSVDQYISMVQEKEIAGPSEKNPEFHNLMPSSEFTPYWLFPGIKPSFQWGPIKSGELRL